jgi:hypothetical protein
MIGYHTNSEVLTGKDATGLSILSYNPRLSIDPLTYCQCSKVIQTINSQFAAIDA